MPPETPPPLPPMPPPTPPTGYSAPPSQEIPPPNLYPAYAPPPPRRGMPTWAWVLIGCAGCFVVGIIVVPILAAILFPVFGSARGSARQVSCLSNMQQIALANMMYNQDYDERMPMVQNWQEGMVPYVKKTEIFHCPETSPAGGESSGLTGTTYAYNSALDRLQLAQVAEPKNTVLHFETTNFSPNASDAMTSLPHPARHRKSSGAGNNVSFVDGHAVFWPEGDSLPEGRILTAAPEAPTAPEAPAAPP